MINKNKQYRTRDGREVRIYATDGGQEYCVHGSVHHIALGWILYTWTKDGKSNILENCDLIEVRPRHKRTVWLNVYESMVCGCYRTKEHADKQAREYRLACIKVELDFEEGEGL